MGNIIISASNMIWDIPALRTRCFVSTPQEYCSDGSIGLSGSYRSHTDLKGMHWSIEHKISYDASRLQHAISLGVPDNLLERAPKQPQTQTGSRLAV